MKAIELNTNFFEKTNEIFLVEDDDLEFAMRTAYLMLNEDRNEEELIEEYEADWKSVAIYQIPGVFVANLDVITHDETVYKVHHVSVV